MEFLPFWLGGLALGSVPVWMWMLEGRTLSVNGQLSRIIDTLADPSAEREAQEFSQRSPEDILAALAAATAKEMGVEAPATTRASADKALEIQAHHSFAARLLFMLCIGLGAAAAALWDGSWSLRPDLGAVHNAYLGVGWQRALLLLGGGLAIGFGTRMSGGCTSGHGLNGCARLVPKSLVATATFLGTAILFTLVTEALL